MADLAALTVHCTDLAPGLVLVEFLRDSPRGFSIILWVGEEGTDGG